MVAVPYRAELRTSVLRGRRLERVSPLDPDADRVPSALAT